MTSKRYEHIKTRKAADPAFRSRLHRAQADSRSRARRAAHEDMVSRGVVCPFWYTENRACWKSYPHRHGDIAYMEANQTS